jgi:hypothetical protein
MHGGVLPEQPEPAGPHRRLRRRRRRGRLLRRSDGLRGRLHRQRRCVGRRCRGRRGSGYGLLGWIGHGWHHGTTEATGKLKTNSPLLSRKARSVCVEVCLRCLFFFGEGKMGWRSLEYGESGTWR